ncbi:MAG: 6-phosphofructokinase [Actinobacteria bacterium]|nr:6-phosphofructokinase [Actinomycetota bacterium]
MIKRIGVLTGGGDSPAINAALRAIFVRSQHYGYTVVGIRNGWEGLVKGNAAELERKDVAQILAIGGTIIGTSRTNPFKIENGVENVKANIAKFALDAIITIGGDDTNGVMFKLSKQYGIKGVGIPQTIDNDIAYSDYSIGFDSSLEIVTNAIDALHTTAFSHNRVMIVEVMGRDAGWLALCGGIAGGADVILIPEVDFDYNEIVNVLKARKERGANSSMIVVAEGAKPANCEGPICASDTVDNFGHVQLGGIGKTIADELEKRTGFECRVTVLGHLQRGGKPTAFDRLLGTRLGATAVDFIHEGKFGNLVVMNNGKITAVPLEKALTERKPMDLDLYELSKLFY